MAMHKGHLDQTRMNSRTTQRRETPIPHADTITQQQTMEQEVTHDAAPPEPPSARTRYLYVECHATTGMIFTDPTGRFLTPRTSGNQYILVVYEYDGNFIHAEPMVDRKGPSIIAAYKQAVSLFESRGFKPLLQQLDNEASSALQSLMDDNGIAFKLAPPHCHRRNAAERAIHTFKNHFIAGLCFTNRYFPLYLWDKLLPQSLLTLNLLRSSRINPQVSTQAHMHGAFDFNRTPLAPPGTKVLIHEKPDIQGTWAPHAVKGWYLGPATRHYRCYRVWAWNTNAERVADTLACFPTATVVPIHSSTDLIMAAAQDLTHALLHPVPSSPLSPLADSQRHRLLQLADIFHQHTHRHDHIPSEPPAASLSLVPPPNPLPFHDPDSVPTITLSPTLTDTPTTHPIERVVPFPSLWGRTWTRAPTMPHCTTPPAMNPAPLPRVVPTLVPPIIAAPQSPSSSVTPASPPQKRITWADSVTGGIAPISTYQSATINPSIRRRRATKAQKLTADHAAFLSISITIHPGLTSISCEKGRPASRRTHRRKRGRQLPTPQSNHTQPRPNRAHIVIHHHLANFAAKITKTAAHLHSAFIDADTGKSYEDAQLIRGDNKKEWLYSTSNEFGRLTNGVKPHMLSGSKTMRYIPQHALPPGRRATYSRFVATERPHKA
jgi:hypothetical protein